MTALTIYEDDDSITKIYKKRLNILIEQAKHFGPAHCPPHILIEIKETSSRVMESYREVANRKIRRQQELKLKQATYGLSADPAISIEIEDLDQEIDGFGARIREIELYTK